MASRSAIFSIVDKLGRPSLITVRSNEVKLVSTSATEFVIEVPAHAFRVIFTLPEEGSIVHSFEINDPDVKSIEFNSTPILWLIDVVNESNYKGPVWWRFDT